METSAKAVGPKKLTNTTLLSIASLMIQNRFGSCFSLSKSLMEQGILISTTIYKGRKNLQLNFKQPKIRQVLNEEQKYFRVKFFHSLLCSAIDFQKKVGEEKMMIKSFKIQKNIIHQ